MNKVLLAGEVIDKNTVDLQGKKLDTFTVEAKERYKDKAGEVKIWSTRIKCTYDGSTHGYLEKGDFVVAEGKLVIRSFDSEKGKVWITEVRCDQVNRVQPHNKSSNENIW